MGLIDPLGRLWSLDNSQLSGWDDPMVPDGPYGASAWGFNPYDPTGYDSFGLTNRSGSIGAYPLDGNTGFNPYNPFLFDNFSLFSTPLLPNPFEFGAGQDLGLGEDDPNDPIIRLMNRIDPGWNDGYSDATPTTLIIRP